MQQLEKYLAYDPRVESSMSAMMAVALNEFYVESICKGRGSATKETGALPMPREIEESEGYVLTPRNEDLLHSVFGPVATIPRRVHHASIENVVVGDGLPDHLKQSVGLINRKSSS
jgi:hypothetical protein